MVMRLLADGSRNVDKRTIAIAVRPIRGQVAEDCSTCGNRRCVHWVVAPYVGWSCRVCGAERILQPSW